MAQTVQVKRGVAASIPSSALLGEPLYTTDEKDLYMGNGAGNPLTLIGGAKVGSTGTPDYLNASYFEQDGTNHIRIKQSTLLSGVNVEQLNGKTSDDFVEITGDKMTGDLQMSNASCSHGLTAFFPSDIGGDIGTGSGGQLQLRGVSDSDISAITIDGAIGVTDPTDTTAAISLAGGKYNGSTSWQALGNNETVLSVKNYTTKIFTMLGSGNLGLGHSDMESWNSNLKVLEFPKSAIAATVTNSTVYFLSNAYIDNTNTKYKLTDKASMYYQSAGRHLFNIAASGTIDTEITWTEALQINNDGLIIINSSVSLKDSSGELQVRNAADSAYSDLRVKNLYVEGTETILNTETLEVSDNNIVLNSNVTEAPTEDAGITIERGTSTDASILWDETNDIWKMGLSGSEVEVSLLGHNHDSDYVELTGDTMSGPLYIDKNYDGNTELRIVNINTGTSATAQIYLESNIGVSYIFKASTNYTTANLQGNTVIYDPTSDIVIKGGGSVESRFTSAGNLCLNKATPDHANYQLDVAGMIHSDGNVLVNGPTTFFAHYGLGDWHDSNNEFIKIYHSGSNGFIEVGKSGTGSYHNLSLQTNGSTSMLINTDNNIGIGTTDIESWDSSYDALEFTGSAIMGQNTGTGIYMMSNAYFDGAWKYKTTAVASQISLTSGQIELNVVASGTIDTGITWVNALTVNNSGSLNITKQLISTLATGTAPFSISSTTLVSNLNADLLDGQEGSYYRDWANLTNGPSSSVADIDDAVSKKHTQNTDTGTSNSTFQIGTSGPLLKNSSGNLQVRNSGDTDFGNIEVENLAVNGTTTGVSGRTV